MMFYALDGKNNPSSFITMSNIIIKKATSKDLLAIATISVTSWQDTYKNIIDNNYLNNLCIKTRYEKFKSIYQTNPFFIAKINNNVVGFCRYKEPTSNNNYPELTVLYVTPNLKRKNIGSTLFNYVTNKLKEKNYSHMLVNCLVGNTIGEYFYLKHHGKIIGENTITINNKKYQENTFLFDLTEV